MSKHPRLTHLLFVSSALLTACAGTQDVDSTENPPGLDPAADGDEPGSDITVRWSQAGHVPTVATQFAVSSGSTFVVSDDGFYEHNGSRWSSLGEAVGQVQQVSAVDGAVAVSTADGLLLRADGEADFSQVAEVGEGWVFLASGEAGLFSSSSLDPQAYQIWPEVREVGSAHLVCDPRPRRECRQAAHRVRGYPQSAADSTVVRGSLAGLRARRCSTSATATRGPYRCCSKPCRLLAGERWTDVLA